MYEISCSYKIATFSENSLVTDVICTVKPVLSSHSKKDQKFGFQDRSLLNAGQKYCRMLHREHSAILSTFIKLPFTIKTFVLSIFKWPLKTGFTVLSSYQLTQFMGHVGVQHIFRGKSSQKLTSHQKFTNLKLYIVFRQFVQHVICEPVDDTFTSFTATTSRLFRLNTDYGLQHFCRRVCRVAENSTIVLL